MEENTIRDISTGTAKSIAQDFLDTIPSDASQALSPQFLQSLGNELRAELQVLIQSRLLWSQQAVQLELAAMRRQKESEVARPKPTQPEPLPQRLKPASRPVAKRHISRKVVELQKTPPTTDAGVKKEVYSTIDPAPVYDASQIESRPATPLQYTHLDLLGLPEPEPRRTPEPSRENIPKLNKPNLENFHHHASDATLRRRRRSTVATTS